jgi:Na+/proline symporter
MEFKIVQLERQLPSGGITTAHWTVSKEQDGILVSSYGAQGFQPDPQAQGFVAFPQVTEAQVIGWVQAAMGTEAVAALEASLDAQIAAIQTPATATGMPWTPVVTPTE